MLAAASVGASLPLALRGQQAKPKVMAMKLEENLVLISGAGGNVVLVITPDGLALGDGGLPDRSSDLLSLVSEQGQNAQVKVLFNTHWHLDHTGSNETLGKAGAKIVAHTNTRKWLKTRVFVEAQNRTYEPRPAEAIPTDTFYNTGKLTIGKVTMEYGHLPFGHTDGDIYIFFPEANIMMVSDTLAVGRYPVMDYSTGGWIGGLQESNNAVLKMIDDRTRLVPGNGGLQTKADLKAQLDMVTAVREKTVLMVREGKGYSEIVAAAPTKQFDEKWGKPDQFVNATYRGIIRNLHEIGGII